MATAGEAEEGAPLLAGAVQSLWVQPVPWECVQGVSVAVEAERDTGADEDHLPPVALANKSSQAHSRSGAKRGEMPIEHQRAGTTRERPRLPGPPVGSGASSHQSHPSTQCLPTSGVLHTTHTHTDCQKPSPGPGTLAPLATHCQVHPAAL